MNLYVRAKNETAGKVSASAGIRAEVLADIESVDVKQCRAASSSVESCENICRMESKRQRQSVGLGVSEAATDLSWLLFRHEPGNGNVPTEYVLAAMRPLPDPDLSGSLQYCFLTVFL